MQHLGRDELGLADDPVERGMLRREAKERREAEELALGSRPALRRGFGHRLPDSMVQVEDELVEDLLLVREVEVERALPDAGGLGELHDRGVVIAELCEHLLRSLEQAPPRHARRATTVDGLRPR